MSVSYKGVELDGLDKKVGFYHSNALVAAGVDGNTNADYLEKLAGYKKAELTPVQFDEINKLWSVMKMNYQICNGGIAQYFGNDFDEGWKSEDGETEIWDKDAQVETLYELYKFAGEVFPDNLVENSKLLRMVRFFESLKYDRDEVYDEYEDGITTDLVGFYVGDFDGEYYEINNYLEQLIELYAQYLDKSIEKEKGYSVETVIKDAAKKSGYKSNYTEEEQKRLNELFDLMGESDDPAVHMAARAEVDRILGHPGFHDTTKEFDK